jgi:hypothetical protein
MANHFTPEELASELGTGTSDVIQLCVREGIPIYKGKVPPPPPPPRLTEYSEPRRGPDLASGQPAPASRLGHRRRA